MLETVSKQMLNVFIKLVYSKQFYLRVCLEEGGTHVSCKIDKRCVVCLQVLVE